MKCVQWCVLEARLDKGWPRWGLHTDTPHGGKHPGAGGKTTMMAPSAFLCTKNIWTISRRNASYRLVPVHLISSICMYVAHQPSYTVI